MRTLSRLFLITLLIPGCAPSSPAVPLTPGAKFEIYSLTTAADPAAIEATDPHSGEPFFLKSPPFITSADVATIRQTGLKKEGFLDFNSDPDEEPGLLVELTPTGATKMSTATTALIGNRIAFVMNGDTVTAPKVHAPISNSFYIEGDTEKLYASFESLTKQSTVHSR